MKQHRLEDEVDRARARRTDPGTSHAAARSIEATQLRESQRLIYRLLEQHGPMSDVEIYGRMVGVTKISSSGCRTRRKELVEKGYVQATGRTVKLSSGRQAIVWEVTP